MQSLRILARMVVLLALALPLDGVSRVGTIRAEEQSGLQTLTIQSTALGGATKVYVLLPAGYAGGTRRYPVLYLLHWLGGMYASWNDNTDVTILMQHVPLIVVMPDADNGWYANAVDRGQPQWESYHIGELIPYVDRRFRTIATRGGRAIAGASMGGMGALSYAARHPDLFSAAGSFSGALDLRLETDNLGPTGTDMRFWSGHDPVELAANLQGVALYLAAGNGTPGPLDPAGSTFDASEATKLTELTHMVSALQHAHVSARVDAYGLGTHSGPYFERDLHHALPLLMAIFAYPTAAPSPWSYRTTEVQFDVWGYHVERQGGTPGWTSMTGVGSRR
jgi:S-formylglutathione hydrolase FrmB